MPKPLRADCLALAITELCRGKILTPEGLSFSRTHGPIRLLVADPLDEQVGANARGFITSGAGLVKVTWDGGGVAVNVESRPSKIEGYRPWVLLCPCCHGDKRKLLITLSGELGCSKCLGVRYPDQRRRLSWGSWVKAQDEMWEIRQRTADSLEWLREQRARDGLPPSENLERLCSETSEAASGFVRAETAVGHPQPA